MYVPLRVHTPFSLAEGAVRIPDLLQRCKIQGYPAVGITDTHTLSGAFQFSKALSKIGVQPLIGCKISLSLRDQDPRHRLNRNGSMGTMSPDRLIVFAKNHHGYQNLIKISSQIFRNSHQTGGMPEISLDFLKAHHQDLLVLTGGTEGPVGRLILHRAFEAAHDVLLSLREIFGNRLYVELTRLGIPGEKDIEPFLIDWAYTQGLPLVGTNPAYFLDPAFHEAHEVLLCIAEGKYISQTDRRTSSPEYRLKTPEEMAALFADLPEALESTVEISKRCAFMVQESKPLLPSFPTPLGEHQELRRQAWEGLAQRLETQVFAEQDSPEQREKIRSLYAQRLEFELEVIHKMGFDGYFLIVADFIQWAFAQKIPVGPGRGSGAASVVAWSLKITGLDPLRFGLLFERFLNPERVSMPDFDIDFCQERRDEVIAYVAQKYGSHRVAQIITFGKLQARAVVRDVGRVLQMPYGQVDRLCKLIPQNPTNPLTLEQAIASEPQLQEARDTEESVERLLHIGLQLEGLYRHASTHAAGVVISGKPLEEIVGLYYDPRSALPATQFNMKDIESVGLVKFDFLGLKTLSVLQKTLELLEKRGVFLTLDTLSLEDEKTYALLQRVETIGIFQLESSGMRDVLGKMKPDRIEDLIALVALYRPGPMENIPQYIACKHGEQGVTYPHKLLESVLKETYGIAVYQEQVMEIAQVFAGYTLGGADLLRRAMGKKIKAEMDAQRQTFIEGAQKQGVGSAEAKAVFEQVEKFAGYGFNKAHAAAYGILSYQTAFLKANTPVEFMAASMTFDQHNTDKLAIFKQDLDRMGIALLPPDINHSEAFFKVEPLTQRDPGKQGDPGENEKQGTMAIRYALGALKNVGEGAMQAVVEEREARGPFEDILDFARRLESHVLNKRQLENLIQAGAFDRLHPNRYHLMVHMEFILSHLGRAHQERHSKQSDFFSTLPAKGGLKSSLPAEEGTWSPLEKLQKEFEAVGFYLSAHPLEAYASVLEKSHKIKARQLPEFLNRQGGEPFKLAGILISKQERISKNSGQRFAFAQFSDETGIFEVGVFSDVFTQYRDILTPGLAVSLTVSGRMEETHSRLTLKSLEKLEEIDSKTEATLSLKIMDLGALQGLQKLFSSLPKGKTKILLTVATEGYDVEIALPHGYALGQEKKSQLFALKGVTKREEFVGL